MPQIRKSIEINAPVSEVFAYLSNPENLPEIWPSLIEVSNIKTAPDGKKTYDWVYKMAGMRFRGHTELTFDPNRSISVKNEGDFKSTFRWRFEGRDDSTTFESEVDYEMPHRLIARLAAPFIHKLNDREADTFGANLKGRLEEGTHAAQPEARPHA